MMTAMNSVTTTDDWVHANRPVPTDMPIPDRLNTALVVLVQVGTIFLLWLGSQVDAWYAVLGVGVVFSYLLLTNYALLHESAHGNLHSSSLGNRLLGTFAGFLFPCPYTMMRTCHQGHHLRNRTDSEMFDLYYPTDSRLVRFVQWYGILCGFFWPWIPIGALLVTFFPFLLKTKVWRQARSSNYLLNDLLTKKTAALRVEVFLTIAYFALLFWLLELKWVNTLVLYACFAFNWSTRQYVGHAFTKREVIDGAWNLQHNRLMSFIMLHNEWDLNHHQRPEVSWYYLPSLPQTPGQERSYWRQYLRLWTGPQLTMEPAPESLQSLPLSVHDVAPAAPENSPAV